MALRPARKVTHSARIAIGELIIASKGTRIRGRGTMKRLECLPMIVGPGETGIFRWHRWFAWHPVVTQEGRRAWGQIVYRKGVPSGIGLERSVFFVYSLAPKDDDTGERTD